MSKYKNFRLYVNSNKVVFHTDNLTVAKKAYNRYANLTGLNVTLCSSTVELIPGWHMVSNFGYNSIKHLLLN